MSILKLIVKILSYICYFFIIIYGVVCVPMIFGYTPLVVLTGSMEPNLPVGSVIYYKEAAKEDIKEGDIITFKGRDNQFISHRVSRILGDGEYQTKGDANNVDDALPVYYKDVKGKVLNKAIPYIGHYIKFINDHLYIVIVAMVILITEFLLSNITGRKEISAPKTE